VPRQVLSTLQDCEDFIRGCLLMATGGGGSAEEGREIFTAALEEGLKIEWVDVEDISDDTWTASPYAMGSIAPLSQETQAAITRLGLVDRLGHRATEVAVRELEESAGVKIGAIVPIELGADSTPDPIVTGARLGIPVVDGDYAGRAVPEEMQNITYLHDKPGWPFTSVDRWGNVCIVKEACSHQMMERIGKMLSVAAYGVCYMAAYLLNGRKDWEDRDGYMFGTTHIKGAGDYAGHTLDVWFENENHVSWLDGEPYVCSPDLVTIVDRETGEGITNTDIDAGRRVAVVGIKGLEAFRSERGLAAAGPRYFGFDIDYVPIEKLMAETSS